MEIILNDAERIVGKVAEKMGLEVHRTGWPDYLFYNREGKEAIFVEVKDKGGCLHKNQKQMHAILRELGFKVVVLRFNYKKRHKVKITEADVLELLGKELGFHP